MLELLDAKVISENITEILVHDPTETNRQVFVLDIDFSHFLSASSAKINYTSMRPPVARRFISGARLVTLGRKFYLASSDYQMFFFKNS